MSDLDPAELDQQAEESAGAEAEAAVDQAAQGEGEGEAVAGVEGGDIPDVETESELEMPSVEKESNTTCDRDWKLLMSSAKKPTYSTFLTSR